MASLNLSSVLEHPARLTPDRVAVSFATQQLTYAQLNATADKVAAGLHALGIRAGDHVALSCPNVPWFPIAYFGILKAGGVVVPLNVLLKPREIAYHLKDSHAKAFLAFEGTPELPIGADGEGGLRGSGLPGLHRPAARSGGRAGRRGVDRRDHARRRRPSGRRAASRMTRL